MWLVKRIAQLLLLASCLLIGHDIGQYRAKGEDFLIPRIAKAVKEFAIPPFQ